MLTTVAAVALAGSLACNNTHVCGQDGGTMLRPDGGEYRCILSEDCPRPSSSLLCTNDTDPLRECVRCESTRCIHVIPQVCQ